MLPRQSVCSLDAKKRLPPESKPLLRSRRMLIITPHAGLHKHWGIKHYGQPTTNTHTHMHIDCGGESINTAEQSVRVPEVETVTVFKSTLQKSICLLLTVHKQFFLYPAHLFTFVCARTRRRKEIAFWKIVFDSACQSQTCWRCISPKTIFWRFYFGFFLRLSF